MRIQVQDLTIQYRDFALHIPRWEIPSGSRLLVEGPSGCGKTSFLHALAGLLPVQKGQIQFDGVDFVKGSSQSWSQFRWDQLGIVFQKLHFLPHLTLHENLQLLCPQDTSIRDTLLQNLGLQKRANHFPRELSQGELQRAAVIRSLLNRPRLLLADEPTSSLDDRNADLVALALKSAPPTCTVLIVSHDGRLRRHFPQVQNFQALVRT